MKTISKHFVSDESSQLVLNPRDWSHEQYRAFLDIFGLSEADEIVIQEYRIETHGTERVNDADWMVAYDHLNMVMAEYAAIGQSGMFGLYGVLVPLKRRYDMGERSKELYDEIMSAE